MNKLGRNVALSDETTLGDNVTIGNNVTSYGTVEIGDGTTIFDGAVLGRPPMSAGNTTRPIAAQHGPLHIGRESIVGANAVLYTGSSYGDRVLIGDLASIREGCVVADDVVVGRGVLVMYEASIGARTRVIDGAIITGLATIEEDVFIGPGVNSINDNEIYLKRFGLPAASWRGATIRRFAVIGAGANLSAGIEIGRGALVAPSAMVTKDVDPWSVVAGVPARMLRCVSEDQKRQILDRFGIAE